MLLPLFSKLVKNQLLCPVLSSRSFSHPPSNFVTFCDRSRVQNWNPPSHKWHLFNLSTKGRKCSKICFLPFLPGPWATLLSAVGSWASTLVVKKRMAITTLALIITFVPSFPTILTTISVSASLSQDHSESPRFTSSEISCLLKWARTRSKFTDARASNPARRLCAACALRRRRETGLWNWFSPDLLLLPGEWHRPAHCSQGGFDGRLFGAVWGHLGRRGGTAGERLMGAWEGEPCAFARQGLLHDWQSLLIIVHCKGRKRVVDWILPIWPNVKLT